MAQPVSTSVSAVAKSMPFVLIDPGHGGLDGGTVSSDGVMEKDLNLAISLQLYDLLRYLGVDTALTRDTDCMLGDRKAEDIYAREAAALQITPPPLFVSIHQNQFPQTNCHGAQVFYGVQHPESQPIASHLQQRIIDTLQPDNHRVIAPGPDSVYLLTHLTCPTVMIECGFLSNPTDLAYLTNPEYQNQLAFVIACSLLEYYTAEGEIEHGSEK